MHLKATKETQRWSQHYKIILFSCIQWVNDEVCSSWTKQLLFFQRHKHIRASCALCAPWSTPHRHSRVMCQCASTDCYRRHFCVVKNCFVRYNRVLVSVVSHIEKSTLFKPTYVWRFWSIEVWVSVVFVFFYQFQTVQWLKDQPYKWLRHVMY